MSMQNYQAGCMRAFVERLKAALNRWLIGSHSQYDCHWSYRNLGNTHCHRGSGWIRSLTSQMAIGRTCICLYFGDAECQYTNTFGKLRARPELEKALGTESACHSRYLVYRMATCPAIRVACVDKDIPSIEGGDLRSDFITSTRL
jgi:hypothetical protein